MGYKKYEKYKDSGVEWIGKIPEGWELTKIKFISSLFSGNGFKVDLQGKLEGDYPFYKVSDINSEGKFATIASNYVDRIDVRKHKWKIIPANSVLFAKIGEALKKNHRKINVVDCLIDNNTAALKPNETSVDVNYFYYLLCCINAEWFVNPGAVPSINNGKLKDLIIALPLMTEQTAIANFLDKKTAEIESLIADKEKMIQLLQEKQQAIISEAVTKGLDPNVSMKDSGVEWIGEIPEHWEVSKVKYFYDICLGKMIQPKPNSSDDTLEYYLCSVNVTWDGIDTSNVKKMWFSPRDKEKYEIKAGDLIVCEGGDAGRAGIWDGCIDSCYIQNAVHRVRGKEGNSVKCLYYWLYFLKHIGYIDLICNKATIMHYTHEKFTNSLLVVPPAQEQNQIVKYLDKEIAGIKMLESSILAQVAKLKEYRQSLIFEAVTGKIDVRDFTLGSEGVVINA